MAKIILNGAIIDEKFDAVSLLELIVAVEEKHIPEEDIVTEVKVDGFAVTEFTHEDGTLVPYRPDSTVEITTQRLIAIMKKSLTEFSKYLDRLLPGLKEIARLYSEGKDGEANALYLEAIDGIKVMIELVQNMTKNEKLDLKGFTAKGHSLQSLNAELSKAVEKLIQAQTSGDNQALAQALENETYKVLQKWQEFLPEVTAHLEQMER